MSEDNYYEIVKDYVNAGIVTLIEWPFLQSQIKAYRNCIKTYSIESDWIGFIDLDEFVVPIITNTIGEFLDTKSNYASVLIHWKIFGSNSLIERDITTPVIESFNCCWPKLSDIGKCFYNTHYNIANDLELNASLHHIFWSQIGEHIVPPIDCCNIFCEAKTKLEGKLHQEIQINHYVTKSFKEYTKKMNGTDVYFKNNPHTKEMFDFHDLKCISQDNYIFQYLNRLKQQL